MVDMRLVHDALIQKVTLWVVHGVPYRVGYSMCDVGGPWCVPRMSVGTAVQGARGESQLNGIEYGLESRFNQPTKLKLYKFFPSDFLYSLKRGHDHQIPIICAAAYVNHASVVTE